MRISVKNKLKINGVDIINTTITENGNSDSLKKTWVDQLMLFVEIGAVSDSDTITFTVQSSYDNVTWFDHTSGATISAAGIQLITESNIGPYVRVKWAVAGASISMTGVKLTMVTKGGQ